MNEELLKKLKKSVEERITFLCNVKNLDGQWAKERDFLLEFWKTNLKDLSSFVYE